MRVLVTGGAGYIGSHSCKAIARAGHDVIAYDNLSTGHAAAVRWGPLERGDIRDRGRLEAALSRHQPDLVMHFAALAYVGESMVDPAAYYDVNVGGTLTLLDAAAGMTGDGTAPVDMSISSDGKYLYVLSAKTESVIAFAVQEDGSLKMVDTFGGLPKGSGGIAVR